VAGRRRSSWRGLLLLHADMHDADVVTCRTACCNNATDAADLRLFGLKVRHGANASARSNNEWARARAKASAPLPCGHDDMTCRPAACRPWPFHAPCALRRRRVSRMPITHTVGIGDPLDPTCNFGEQGSRARAQHVEGRPSTRNSSSTRTLLSHPKKHLNHEQRPFESQTGDVPKASKHFLYSATSTSREILTCNCCRSV